MLWSHSSVGQSDGLHSCLIYLSWLESHTYNVEVLGSSPRMRTMKEKISDYYKEKGFEVVYIATNKEPRRVATLKHRDGSITSMSYAKYLYTSYHKCDVERYNHIDHINGDKMDDRIENLQILSGRYNIQKDHKHKEMVMCTCPVCGKEFLFEKRNISTRPNPCCSRSCGGKKSHW